MITVKIFRLDIAMGDRQLFETWHVGDATTLRRLAEIIIEKNFLSTAVGGIRWTITGRGIEMRDGYFDGPGRTAFAAIVFTPTPTGHDYVGTVVELEPGSLRAKLTDLPIVADDGTVRIWMEPPSH